MLETVTYVLTLVNFHIGWPSEGDRFADITVLYTKDAYFTVRLLKRYRAFCLEVSFRGRPGGSGRLPPVFVVKACNLTTGAIVPMTKGIEDSYTNHHLCEWIGRQGVFWINIEYLMTEGVLTNGNKVRNQALTSIKTRRRDTECRNFRVNFSVFLVFPFESLRVYECMSPHYIITKRRFCQHRTRTHCTA